MEKEISKLFDSSGNRQIIFINIFEGLNNSLLRSSKILFLCGMIFFGSFCLQCVYLFIQRTLFLTGLCMHSKMFFILRISASAKDCAKNNKI